MKLQEEEPLGEQWQYTFALTSLLRHSAPAQPKKTRREERCSGTERRPFNTIRGCSSGDHDGVAWYDSVNYRGVAGDIRNTSAHCSCETEEDEEEERCSGTERRPFNTIRGCSSGDHDGVAWYDSVNYRGVAGDIRNTSAHCSCETEEDEEEERCSGTERRPFNTIRGCSSGDHDGVAWYDSVNYRGVAGDIRNTSAHCSCETEEDEEEERCSGTERRPFNTIRGCSSGDHDGVAWYDSVNYRGVAGDIRNTSAQCSCETEEDEEEECCLGTERRPFNTIRGCSSGDHDSVAWYDSVNYRGVAGDIRKNHRAPPDVMPEFEHFRNTRRRRRMRQSSARRLRATLRNRLALGTSLFFLQTGLGTTKRLRN
ncbi:hypothetical protein MRX96_014078 [Rhipicephalus microplus]